MDKKEIINQTILFVKKELTNAEGGHDWFHIERVWRTAKTIAKNEPVDPFIIELGALLHDIADAKFYDGDETVGPKKAKLFLLSIGVDNKTIQHIENIIDHISYKNTLAINKANQIYFSKELEVIQDADRLDALGAIGIARAFNYGGYKNRELYNPNIAPNINQSKEAYKKSTAPTINHFYEKLLLLKDKMNTDTGRKMAQKRHDFMNHFLEQFYDEWDGEK
jgi:uncharacterized protein